MNCITNNSLINRVGCLCVEGSEECAGRGGVPSGTTEGSAEGALQVFRGLATSVRWRLGCGQKASKVTCQILSLVGHDIMKYSVYCTLNSWWADTEERPRFAHWVLKPGSQTVRCVLSGCSSQPANWDWTLADWAEGSLSMTFCLVAGRKNTACGWHWR